MNRTVTNVLANMLIVATVSGLGQVLLKIGMQSVDKRLSPIGILRVMLTEPRVLFGLILFALNTILYLRMIQKYPLSLVYPMIAFAYVVVVILSRFVLSEQIPPLRIFAVGVIVLGVVLLAMSAADESSKDESSAAPPAIAGTPAAPAADSRAVP